MRFLLNIFYRLILFLFALLIFVQTNAQTTGRVFHSERRLSEVLKKAWAADRIPLIYLTAKWCGPCRVFERDLARDSSADRLMSTRFYAVKWDIDSLAAGRALRDQYFSAVPSWFAFDRDGQVQYYFSGYGSLKDFINSLGFAERPQTDPLYVMRKQYESRVGINNTFLIRYATALAENRKYQMADSLFKALWLKLTPAEKAENTTVQFIIANGTPGDPFYESIVYNNLDLFEKQTSQKKVIGFLTGPQESQLDDIVNRQRDSSDFNLTFKKYLTTLRSLKADSSLLLSASLYPLQFALAYHTKTALERLNTTSQLFTQYAAKYRLLYGNKLFMWYNDPAFVLLKDHRTQLLSWLTEAYKKDEKYIYSYFIAQILYDQRQKAEAFRFAALALSDAKKEFPTKEPVAPLALMEKIQLLK